MGAALAKMPRLAMTDLPSLALLVLAAACLYSSVGHGGASGYLAAMALVGVAPSIMKPTALVLNVLVAGIASVQFMRAGCFSWSVFWPFAVTSIPLAFVGGAIILPGSLYERLVGVVLLYAAWHLWTRVRGAGSSPRDPPLVAALTLGGAIGLLSGLVGVGGGIFLSPLLLFTGWAEMRVTAGVSAVFILVNSVAGIAGHLTSLALLPPAIPVLALAAFAGGIVGSTYGARSLATPTLRRLLALVLVVAGVKMLAGG
jgi:uncharacterized membrane protein YfcA